MSNIKEKVDSSKPEKVVNWKAQLSKLEGAVTERRLIHNDVLQSRSPSLNACFGNGWGLPYGYSLLLGGKPKGGKSTITNDMIGVLHQVDSKAFAIKVDTEFREEAQNSGNDLKKWGIDEERYMSYERADPDIIDFIDKDLTALMEKGCPIRLLALDSINGIEGFRTESAESARKANNQMGDNAKTQQLLMSKLMHFCRKYKVAAIISAHVGAEMDEYEKMRGNDTRIKTSFGVNHRIEYWMYVEKLLTKAGKQDLLEQPFYRNTGVHMIGSAADKEGDLFAHKIRVKMKNSSFGPVDRVGEFTYKYDEGIWNTHEEVFTMGLNHQPQIILSGGGGNYSISEKTWRGKPLILEALKNDNALREYVLSEIQKREPGHPRYIPGTC